MTERVSRPVEIEYNGSKVIGEQVVEGSRHYYQKVVYNGRSKSDSFRYEPHQMEYMHGIAQQLLREILLDIENGL